MCSSTFSGVNSPSGARVGGGIGEESVKVLEEKGERVAEAEGMKRLKRTRVCWCAAVSRVRYQRRVQGDSAAKSRPFKANSSPLNVNLCARNRACMREYRAGRGSEDSRSARRRIVPGDMRAVIKTSRGMLQLLVRIALVTE